jgi:hypothetical protein
LSVSQSVSYLFIYLFICLGLNVKFSGEKGRAELQDKQTLRATDNSLIRITNVNVKVSESVCEMICVSRMLHGVEMQCVKGDGKLLMKFRKDFIREP